MSMPDLRVVALYVHLFKWAAVIAVRYGTCAGPIMMALMSIFFKTRGEVEAAYNAAPVLPPGIYTSLLFGLVFFNLFKYKNYYFVILIKNPNQCYCNKIYRTKPSWHKYYWINHYFSHMFFYVF